MPWVGLGASLVTWTAGSEFHTTAWYSSWAGPTHTVGSSKACMHFYCSCLASSAQRLGCYFDRTTSIPYKISHHSSEVNTNFTANECRNIEKWKLTYSKEETCLWHCFTQSLSSGIIRITEITVETWNCKGKRTPLMEKAEKAKRESDWSRGKTRVNGQTFTLPVEPFSLFICFHVPLVLEMVITNILFY